jgi:hypothetical protein
MRRSARIVTLCVQGKPPKHPSQNRARIALLRRAVQELSQLKSWAPIDALVLPAGYFRIRQFVGDLSLEERHRRIAREPIVKAALKCCVELEAYSPGALLIFGVDSVHPSTQLSGDQLGIVLNAKKVLTVTGKIFPTANDTEESDRWFVPAYEDYGDPNRVITLPNRQSAILCVCYDTFGLSEGPGRATTRTTAIKGLFYADQYFERTPS